MPLPLLFPIYISGLLPLLSLFVFGLLHHVLHRAIPLLQAMGLLSSFSVNSVFRGLASQLYSQTVILSLSIIELPGSEKQRAHSRLEGSVR